MRLYALLAILALLAAASSMTLAPIEHLFIADAATPELADAVGVDPDQLRPHLEAVLHRAWVRRGIFRSIPWLLISAHFFRLTWKASSTIGEGQRDRR